MDIRVEAKDLKREMFKVRARFAKLQRSILGEALEFAATPLVERARDLAPVGETGRLRERIQFVKARNIRGSTVVEVGPVKFRRNDRNFPFYALFQERGFKAVGRKRRGPGRQIAGKHFLKRAGEQTFSQVESIFARRMFQKFAEIQAAGEAAGLV
jgi:hypothetical protein